MLGRQCEGAQLHRRRSRKKMSTFETDEHLRGCRAGTFLDTTTSPTRPVVLDRRRTAMPAPEARADILAL